VDSGYFTQGELYKLGAITTGLCFVIFANTDAILSVKEAPIPCGVTLPQEP